MKPSELEAKILADENGTGLVWLDSVAALLAEKNAEIERLTEQVADIRRAHAEEIRDANRMPEMLLLRLGGRKDKVETMEAIECSHPDCHCQLGLTLTDLGYLCGVHVQHALDICRGEQRLIECEEKLKSVTRSRDEWKRIAGEYREGDDLTGCYEHKPRIGSPQDSRCDICRAYDALLKGEQDG